MKQRLDHEKMLRDSSDKMTRETAERKSRWLQLKQQQERHQEQQQEQQQERRWQQLLQQSKPTRSAEEGRKYRAGLGGLADAWDAHVESANPND
jgi:hypothetical protein